MPGRIGAYVVVIALSGFCCWGEPEAGNPLLEASVGRPGRNARYGAMARVAVPSGGWGFWETNHLGRRPGVFVAREVCLLFFVFYFFLSRVAGAATGVSTEAANGIRCTN